MIQLIKFSLMIFVADLHDRIFPVRTLKKEFAVPYKPICEGLNEDEYCNVLKAKRERNKGTNPLAVSLNYIRE